MNSLIKCRYFGWYCALSILALLALISLMILRFGNPQWHGVIYVFQMKVSPQKKPKMPEDYSGIWITWSDWGRRCYKYSYKNGIKHGESCTWDEKGCITSRGKWRNGKPWEGSFEIWLHGIPFTTIYYKNGKEVEKIIMKKEVSYQKGS